MYTPDGNQEHKQSPTEFVRELRTAEQWDVVTRWRFERLLDEVATRVAASLQDPSDTAPLEETIGCSLLYRSDAGPGPEGACYVLGGSSRDRRLMDREARYYALGNPEARHSLTGTVSREKVVILLDDMGKANSMTGYAIRHSKKNCELKAKHQNAFLAIPTPAHLDLPVIGEASEPPAPDEGQTGEQADGGTDGVIRFTFSRQGDASRAWRLLPEELLDEISRLLCAGREHVAKNRGKRSLALADLGYDLLSYRHSEYQGLDQLAFHLQTHYDNCECSIFLAKENRSNDEGKTRVDLFLAATTALSESKQHETFKSTFLHGDAHYSCVFGPDGQPDERPSEAAKTARAYYEPKGPLVVNTNLGSQEYPGQGEIRTAEEYLAFAIPSPRSDERPYGVIRLVRYTRDAFSEWEEGLAQATTRYLRSWLELFPLNDKLLIDSTLKNFDRDVLRSLFDIPLGVRRKKERLNKAKREFTWLLQKIFHRSQRVTIKQIFSGRSGSLVLLVENDSGLDLMLKCVKKKNPWEHTDNDIRREVDNYRDFVEGKLELNHNLIFRELVRETQWLIGFATSFLHSTSGQRIPISQACREWTEKMGGLPRLERALTQVIEKLILEVWAWWYSEPERDDEPGEQPAARRREEGRLEELVTSREHFVACLRRDRLFGFLEDLDKFDSRVVHELQKIVGFGEEFEPDGDYPRPSELWKSFEKSLGGPNDTLTWRETVTHGDTHGDNIFFDPVTMDLWVIDFARTGWRTDIFDLALIESDLKFRQLSNLYGESQPFEDDDFVERMIDFEHDLAQQTVYEEPTLPVPTGEPKLQSIGKLIADVRQLACQGLGRRGQFTDYQITLLLLAFKYMKVENAEPEERFLAYLSARELIRVLA